MANTLKKLVQAGIPFTFDGQKAIVANKQKDLEAQIDLQRKQIKCVELFLDFCKKNKYVIMEAEQDTRSYMPFYRIRVNPPMSPQDETFILKKMQAIDDSIVVEHGIFHI